MQNKMTSNNNKIYQKPSCKNIFFFKEYYNYVWFEYNLYVIVHTYKEFELTNLQVHLHNMYDVNSKIMKISSTDRNVF